MKQFTKQVCTEIMRTYQSLLLRSWRSVLARCDTSEIAYSELRKICDSELASMIGITKANFSRIINGVYTVSTPVLVSIYCAMICSIGYEEFSRIQIYCFDFVCTKFHLL